MKCLPFKQIICFAKLSLPASKGWVALSSLVCDSTFPLFVTASKYAKFQNWLKTHSTMIIAHSKHVYHHFGGMLALKSGLCFRIWPLKVLFLGIWKQTLFQKVPYFGYQKWDFERPNKNGNHFFMPISPQIDGIAICLMCLSLLCEFYANFELLLLLDCYWPVFPGETDQN